MPEPILLLIALAVAGAAVVLPLRSRHAPSVGVDDESESAAVRHRVALEALRDVELDRRAGSLDDDAYRAQRAEAATRAAATRAALERAPKGTGVPTAGRGRTGAVAAAAFIGLAVLIGSLVPATGIANETEVNEPLAAQRRAESERQAAITRLRDALAANPDDADVLSELADAHLAGTSVDDLARAAAALQVLIALEPDRADAYERIIAAYLRAGDHANARAALASYEERASADPVEVAFFDGLIALREGDPDRARVAFDRFLELAPDDPRVPMVRGLRDEAAGGG